MGKLSKIEVGTFLNLFNRGGYVLNFTTNEFDVFTMGSIGVALCSEYNMSKGGKQADMIALESDFGTIGNDIQNMIDSLNK